MPPHHLGSPELDRVLSELRFQPYVNTWMHYKPAEPFCIQLPEMTAYGLSRTHVWTTERVYWFTVDAGTRDFVQSVEQKAHEQLPGQPVVQPSIVRNRLKLRFATGFAVKNEEKRNLHIFPCVTFHVEIIADKCNLVWTVVRVHLKPPQEDMCRVCMDNPITIVCLPCAHFCLCDACAQPLRRCPICRGELINKTRWDELEDSVQVFTC